MRGPCVGFFLSFILPSKIDRWPCSGNDKDFTVADSARSSGRDNLLAYYFNVRFFDPDRDFNLGKERQAVFAARIAFQIAFLAAVSFCFADYTGRDAKFGNDVQHPLGPERLNHQSDLLHVSFGIYAKVPGTFPEVRVPSNGVP